LDSPFGPDDDGFLLTDELFLIAHDEYSGKPAVSVEVLETGLAGALLGELVFARRVVIANNAVALVDPRPWREQLSDFAIGELARKGDAYPARAWVEYLRDGLREAVGRRLEGRGVVRREEIRSGLTRRVSARFPGADPVWATRPRVKLGYALGRRGALNHRSAVLAALVHATGMDRLFVDVYGQVAREQLAEAAGTLPMALAKLAAGVDMAVAAIALTVRR
jgi:hypothetical protein